MDLSWFPAKLPDNCGLFGAIAIVIFLAPAPGLALILAIGLTFMVGLAMAVVNRDCLIES